MGMKPRKQTVIPPVPVPSTVKLIDLSESFEGYETMHALLHNLEWNWCQFDEARQAGMLHALALFLGGACETVGGREQMFVLQSLMEMGYRNYGDQRREVCEAIEAAYRFQNGDREAN